MSEALRFLWESQEGQDLTEYALLLVFLALAGIVVMKNLGSAISQVFKNASSSITS